MKKKILTITLFAVVAVSSFAADTTQTKTKEVEKVVEVIPNGYIKLEECIPLEDVACYFINGYDYPCFELKDVGNQLDNPDNRSYEDIMKELEDVTEEYNNNFVDMRTVSDFETTENGLQLYTNDGNCYCWER